MEKEESRTDTQIRIRKAGYDDIDTMKRVLARAYDTEPILNWLVVQDEERAQRMERFFEIQLRGFDSMQHDHVFTTEQLNGIAIWYPPEPQDCWDIPLLKVLRLMPRLISVYGFRMIPSVRNAVLMLAKHHLREPHYYLFAIGVDPADQGKGIGSHLVVHVLNNMCNERGLPAYLETATEENVRFYEKHDFKVREEFRLPKGPKIWTMIYEPSPRT